MNMTTTREQDERAIRELYGTDTQDGHELLIGLINDEIGLAALTDDAVRRLAKMHQQALAQYEWEAAQDGIDEARAMGVR